jgi:hypothetical protein
MPAARAASSEAGRLAARELMICIRRTHRVTATCPRSACLGCEKQMIRRGRGSRGL